MPRILTRLVATILVATIPVAALAGCSSAAHPEAVPTGSPTPSPTPSESSSVRAEYPSKLTFTAGAELSSTARISINTTLGAEPSWTLDPNSTGKSARFTSKSCSVFIQVLEGKNLVHVAGNDKKSSARTLRQYWPLDSRARPRDIAIALMQDGGTVSVAMLSVPIESRTTKEREMLVSVVRAFDAIGQGFAIDYRCAPGHGGYAAFKKSIAPTIHVSLVENAEG
jgi:hypothetical protein